MTEYDNVIICSQCNEGYADGFDKCPNGCQQSAISMPKSRKKASNTVLSVVSSLLIPAKVKIGEKTKYKVRDLIFDSRTEAWRYCYLVIAESKGAISNLVCQPEYVLRPAYFLTGRHYIRTKAGKPRKVSAEKYTPDFEYIHHGLGNIKIIEEVKGLSKDKPYSKQASNYKQYTLQSQIADRDDILFMVAAGKSNGSVWRYFQQSNGYPELSIDYMMTDSEAA